MQQNSNRANGRTRAAIAAALPLALAVGLSSTASAMSSNRDITPMQRPAVELTPEAQALELTVISAGGEDGYVFGETMTLSVTASRDAYVTIFNIGTSGKVHVIFPNSYQSDNFVPGGQTVEIPGPDAKFNLVAAPPAGVDVVKVIATLNPDEVVRPEDVIDIGTVAELKDEAPVAMRDIGVALREKHHRRWAEETVLVEVRGEAAEVSGPASGPAGIEDPVEVSADSTGAQLPGAAAPAEEYTREEFRSVVVGKSMQEIIETVGRPDETQELAGFTFWYYHWKTYDPINGKRDNMAQLDIQRGRAMSVNFL